MPHRNPIFISRVVRAILPLLFLCHVAESLALGLPRDYRPTSGRRALEAAKESGKPILVYFTQENCIWCERLEQLLTRTELNATLVQSYHFMNIDIGNNRDSVSKTLTQMLRVRGTPALAALAPNGDVLCMIYGSLKDDKELGQVHANIQAMHKGAKPTVIQNGYASCRGQVSEQDGNISGVTQPAAK